jgi:probable rRNA maturation factor
MSKTQRPAKAGDRSLRFNSKDSRILCGRARVALPDLFSTPVIIFEKTMEGVSRPALERFARRAKKLARTSGEVDILIAGDRRLRELNRRFRGKNKPTDVLSFSRNGSADAGGDIAISAEYARRSARLHGHSSSDELKILILHGMLHLAGHDHESDQGEMAGVEAQLRQELKLPGSLTERAASARPRNPRSSRSATRPARAPKRSRLR